MGFEGVVPPGTDVGFGNTGGLLPLKVEPLTLVVVDLGGVLLFLPSVLDSISFFSCSPLLVGVRLLALLPGSGFAVFFFGAGSPPFESGSYSNCLNLCFNFSFLLIFD